jgi:hypothetical protein
MNLTREKFKSFNTPNIGEFTKNQEQFYRFIKGSEILEALQAKPVEINEFKSYWHNLRQDRYVNNNIAARKRRIGKFKYAKEKLKFIEGDNSFLQAKSINSLNGGNVRYFAETEKNFCSHILLEKIIEYVLKIIPVSNYNSVNINTHLFRVECSSQEKISFPTPEGIHRDGHDFISQHLISRNNIFGGISGIYHLKYDRPVIHKQLYESFDTIILNDRVFRHDVSPIFPQQDKQLAYRDMLIIDYNFNFI